MSHPPSQPQDSSQTWQRRERLIRRFEAAWDHGHPPAIDDFLPDGADRRPVLIELAHADLECRLKAGDAVRVESYLERYPELGADRAVVLDLIGAEIRLRRQAGGAVDLESYLERFPAYRDELPTLWDADRSAQVRTVAQGIPQAPLPTVPGYEVQRFIARGGMGAVYQARQERLDRVVALKILAPEVAERAVFAERFGREARALARLNHPHIIAVHDFGESDSQYYLVMEFVDGQDLRPRLRAGRLEPALAVRIVGQVCEALQYAHEAGVVHRDIKPENILLDSKDRVKVADFGLAKLLSDPVAKLTGSQQAVGTLHYMAPEQLRRPLEVGLSADIYSLGVLFYEMLTGDLPLGRFAPPSQLAPVEPRFDEIILRMLAKEPEERYASVLEVQAALAELRIADCGLRIADQVFQSAIRNPQSAIPPDGLSMRFFLGATAAFLVGWITTAAAANYGLAGLSVATVLLTILAVRVAVHGVARLPDLDRALRARRRGVALGNSALAVLLFLLGFVALVAAHFVWWDRSLVDPGTITNTYRGQEHSLLQELRAHEKDTPPAVLMTTHAAVSGEEKLALWLAVSSVLLLFGAAVVGLETPCYRHQWALHWQPVLVLSASFLLPLPLLQGLSGLIRESTLPGVQSAVFHSPKHRHRGAADIDHVLGTLQSWADEHDYVLYLRGSWTLESLPERRPLVQVRLLEARRRSLFDRWRITWSGPERRQPFLKIQCLSNVNPTESLVTLDPGLLRQEAELSAEREAIIASLEAALNEQR